MIRRGGLVDWDHIEDRTRELEKFAWETPADILYDAADGYRDLQMICGVYAVLGGYLIAAARKPSENRSLISFTIWASVVHTGIMAAQSIYDEHERGHLIGDVPALLLVAAVLWFLSPAKQRGPDTA